MRKIFMCMSLLMMLAAGCSAGTGSVSVADEQSAESSAETEGEQMMSETAYTTREIWVDNDGRKIYGIAYIPDTGEKAPLVIFSHELGNDHTSGQRYAERLAEAGYAAYIFDFCGGTVGGNRSDGSNSEMSVLTEASDLEAVRETAETWDFADPQKIFLLGGSMGGLVTTVVGTEHQDEIAGMILMYPALSAKADSGIEKYASKDEVPEDVSLFGGWIHVGKNFVTDLWDLDFKKMLSAYRGHMMLLHGDSDSTVPLRYSEEVLDAIPDCEFHVIADGGHEFFGQPFEDAMSYILPYLEGQLNSTETQLQMMIGDTPVEAAWETNASVETLKDLCRDEPLKITMSKYGGFEQVGPIGQSLPADDVQTDTVPGDIVLYSGNQIVVFYGTNSWAYTRIGHITDKSQQELAELLGNEDTTITFSIGQ